MNFPRVGHLPPADRICLGGYERWQASLAQRGVPASAQLSLQRQYEACRRNAPYFAAIRRLALRSWNDAMALFGLHLLLNEPSQPRPGERPTFEQLELQAIRQILADRMTQLNPRLLAQGGV